MRSSVALRLAAVTLCTGISLSAQSSPIKRRESIEAVRFIYVQPGVKLEVLDWGGTGRPLVLLAGLGNTAHVFEELAQRLRADYHVYGVTRRGFGQSSEPGAGYSADRLGDDVLAVMDSLRLAKPVLIGHSIAGEELSSIGSRHPDRVSGLVYLDAADSYAFYDTTTGDYRVDLSDLRRKLDTLQQAPTARLINELLSTTLPTFQRDLRDVLAYGENGGQVPPQPPGYEARASFPAFHAWLQLAGGFAVPIAELREQYEELPDGSVGRRFRAPEDALWFSQAIIGGLQKYRSVSVPMLAIFANPHALGAFVSDSAKAKAIARDSIGVTEQIAVVRRAVPQARIVELRGAHHYLFLTNQADVLREINAFVKSLPDSR